MARQNGPTESTEVGAHGLDKLNDVQDILQRNKVLIAEIQNNHEAGSPAALLRNVHLIQELRNNIGKVVSMYGEISDNFVLSVLQKLPQPSEK